MWKFYNANPNKFEIEDCTIRAISTVEGISWDKAYEKLSYYARKKRLMMNSVEFIEEYLDERYKRKCHYGITVGEFARKHPRGKYLVTMPRTHYSN